MCRLWDTFQFEGAHERLSAGRQSEPYLELIASTKDAQKAQAKYPLSQSLPFRTALSSISCIVCPFWSIALIFSLSSYCSLDSSYSSSPQLDLHWFCLFSFHLVGSRNGCPSSNFGCPHTGQAPLLLGPGLATCLQFQNQREAHYKINQALLILRRTYSFHPHVVGILNFPSGDGRTIVYAIAAGGSIVLLLFINSATHQTKFLKPCRTLIRTYFLLPTLFGRHRFLGP